jgi:hypothetical protein
VTVQEAYRKANSMPDAALIERCMELCMMNGYTPMQAAVAAVAFEAGRIFEAGSMTCGDIPLEMPTR